MSTPLSSNLPWGLANNKWAQSLNPIVASPISSASILQSISLTTGANTINHGLGRTMQGWFITDVNGVAIIYRSQPLNASTLTLTSSASVIVNIGVF